MVSTSSDATLNLARECIVTTDPHRLSVTSAIMQRDMLRGAEGNLVSFVSSHCIFSSEVSMFDVAHALSLKALLFNIETGP